MTCTTLSGKKMMYAEEPYNKDNIAKLAKSLQEIMDKPVP